MVSLDTAIAIGFGILSAFISLIGVLLSYLTLRATTTNHHEGNPRRLDEYGTVLRHEHTHFTPQPYTPRQSERRELRWRE